MTRHRLIAAALAVLAGCGTEPTPPVPPSAEARPPSLAESASPLASGRSSPHMNGTSVLLVECTATASTTGGTPIPYGCSNNGSVLSSTLERVSLDAIRAPNGAVYNVSLEGNRYTTTVKGKKLSDKDFVGALFNSATTDGIPVSLRLDSAVSGTGAQADVWRYGFSYQDPTGAWRPLCPDSSPAVAVPGLWDYHEGQVGDGAKRDDHTAVTVACQGSAVEKCINVGYKPWAKVGSVSLDAFHQACVRMMRADYCGDGVSHTTAGQMVNIYDGLGIEVDGAAWVVEAEWTPSGARCLNPLNLTPEEVPCQPLLGTASCGDTSHFGTGTLIISETPTTGGRTGL